MGKVVPPIEQQNLQPNLETRASKKTLYLNNFLMTFGDAFGALCQ
jgi:hypothetical protein